MMMESIKISNALADAIEYFRETEETCIWNHELMCLNEFKANATLMGAKDIHFESIKNADNQVLAVALYVGYEREKTFEQEVRELFDYNQDNERACGAMLGIMRLLGKHEEKYAALSKEVDAYCSMRFNRGER